MIIRCLLACFLFCSFTSVAGATKPYWGMNVGPTEPLSIESELLPDDIANPVFAANGEEFYYVDAKDKNIYYSKIEQGNWTRPQIAGFSDAGNNAEPFISADSHMALFISNRAINGVSKLRIYKSERENRSQPWSRGVLLLESASEQDLYFPNVGADGTLYFGVDKPGVWNSDDMYMKIDDKVSILPAPLNSDKWEWDPFLSPDGSYMVFCSNRHATEDKNTDIFVSFRQGDNSWGPAIALGDSINTGEFETAATITNDGKFMLFTRNYKAGMKHYIVSTEVIQQLK